VSKLWIRIVQRHLTAKTASFPVLIGLCGLLRMSCFTSDETEPVYPELEKVESPLSFF
jgi:hypothetical protein